jgi:hypothetical protein
MQTVVSKKLRAQREEKARSLRTAVTKIYVSLVLCISDNIFLQWVEKTTTFPQLLRCLAREHFEDREDVSRWEQGLCQIISDLAQKEMTGDEFKTRDISFPRDIILWFADFLERTFSKPLIRWDSPLFAKELVHRFTDQLVQKSKDLELRKDAPL